MFKDKYLEEKTMKKVLFVLIALTSIALFCACSPAQETTTILPVATPEAVPTPDTPSYSGTIKVQGESEIKVSPDTAHLSFEVHNTGGSTEEVTQDNAETAKLLTEALVSQGALAEDIVTDNFYVYPIYDYDSADNRVIGYEATTRFSFETKAVDNGGKFVDAAAPLGVYMSGLYYTLSDDSTAYMDAMTAASEDAYKKAQSLAAASGATVGHAVSITEGYTDENPVFYANYEIPMASAAPEEWAEADDGYSTNFMYDDLNVRSVVTIFYELVN